MKRKIIFIYGFLGRKSQARFAKRFFSNYKFFVFNYDSWLTQSIKEVAQELKIFIDNKTKKGEKIFLIGISAGGNIAEYYAKLICPKKVDGLATVCSPLRGTFVPKIFSKKLRGLHELRKKSPVLNAINNSRTKINEINLYSPYDFLVPGISGKGRNPMKTLNFIHFTVQMDRTILKKVKDFFER